MHLRQNMGAVRKVHHELALKALSRTSGTWEERGTGWEIRAKEVKHVGMVGTQERVEASNRAVGPQVQDIRRNAQDIVRGKIWLSQSDNRAGTSTRKHQRS